MIGRILRRTAKGGTATLLGVVLAALALAAACGAAISFAAPESTSPGTSSQVATAVPEPDGSTLIAGSLRIDRGAAELARLRPDGSLDPSFADSGYASAPGALEVTAAALQSDGKVVLAGMDSGGVGVARVDAEGSPDRTFGNGGIITVPGLSGTPRAILIEPTGTIVVAIAGAGSTDVVRLLPTGTPDPTFGDGGQVSVSPATTAEAAALQPDEKLVDAGVDGGRISVSRFGSGGQPDTAFGAGGSAAVPTTGVDRVFAVLTQPDGGTTVLATSANGTTRHLVVARLTADGSLDQAFGNSGVMLDDVTSPEQAGSVPSLALARMSPDGSIGQAPLDFVPQAAALQADGAIVLAGASAPSATPKPAPTPNRAPPPVRLRPTASPTPAKPKPLPKPHRPPPPNPVPAWYINATNFTELKRFAAADACSFAKTQPKGRRTLILDFGGARAYPNGTFGAAVNNSSFNATNRQIRAALKVASDAYVACHKRGQARITYAVTNHFSTKFAASNAREIGIRQASTANHLRAYEQGHRYLPSVAAGVAGDIEMGYWGPQLSKSLVSGARAKWKRGYVDFGTAGGCPPHPRGLHMHGCFNGWRLVDVAYVSQPQQGNPVPEIYYRGGPSHFNQAAEWANVAKAWNRAHTNRYRFFGATGSTEFTSMSPGESWRRLRTVVKSPVGRELLNFKQDQWPAK